MADRSPQVAAVEPEGATQPLGGVVSGLAQSFAIYGSANFGIRALNFLLIVVYAHYLRPYDYGIIYMAEIIASFLIIFGGLSIDSALQRLYFQHNHDAEELRSYLATAIRFGLSWMAAFLALVLVAGGSLHSRLPASPAVPFYPYIAMAIVTATASQGVQYRLAIYQAARRPGSYALLSLFFVVLTAACCVYGVVIRRGGALGMMKGKLVAATITFLVAAWSMRALLTARFQWRFVRESLSFSLPLIPHLVMASGLVVADRFILEHYRDLSEVGIYSLAYTLGMVMFLVTQSLSQAWLPMFFELAVNRKENHQVLGRICSGLVIGLIALACSGMLLAPSFVHVALDHRYRPAAQIVPLVVMGYLFHALFSLFNLSILQAKRTAFVFVASVMAFVVNLGLNFTMIPRWGMYGAAWATTIAYAIEALVAYLFAQRFFVLSYGVPEILGGLTVAGGALALTQSAWILKWNGLFSVLSTIAAFGLLALIGKRDIQASLTAMRKARKRQAQQAAG
ncbi:MAG: oligosaccharide flippase family protein [Silvibacterium sp.]